MVLLKRDYILILISLLCCSRLPGQTISGVVNDYRRVIAIDTAKGFIRLSNASNCTQYIGHSLMIIQMKGAMIDESNTSNFGNITAIHNAGRFEIGKMCGQLTDSIILENKIQNFYDVSGFVQIVFIPKYTNVTVAGMLKALPWDPVAGMGGVVAIEASGTITLNASISADSAGFRGGALLNQTGTCFNFLPAADYYYDNNTGSYASGAKKGEGVAEYIPNKDYGKGKQANGGGGGNNANNGGGGGSNYSVGGVGGNKSTNCNASNPGIGGTPLSVYGYSTSNFRIFLGGGGGAGHENNDVGTPGGQGGGIVYLKANSIINSGNKITANGSIGYNPANTGDPYSSISDGGGGGGAGGVVILQTNSIVNPLIIEAKGAKGCDTEVNGTGFCAGPGGGGSGGYVWLSATPIPVNVTINVSGGTNGVIQSAPCVNFSNGATSGSTGSSSGGFTFPALKDSSPICKQILPFKLITSFSGFISNGQVQLTLELNNTFEAQKCILQYSSDGVHYNDVFEQPGSHVLLYHFTDNYKSSPSYYRAKVMTITGGIEYSQTIYFKPNVPAGDLAIYPNPVKNTITMHVKMLHQEFASVKVYDVEGRIVYSNQYILQEGENAYQILLPTLNKGVYSLQVITKSISVNKVFVHL